MATDTSTVSVLAADEQDYYSISRAATLLGVSRVTVWRWIAAGRLPVWRLGHRTARIRRADLERLLVPGNLPDVDHRASLARAIDGADSGRTLPAPGGEGNGHPHVVQFYESDAYIVEAVVAFIGAALRLGDAGIVIATEPHRAAIEERLRSDGLDLDAARAAGYYVARDAAETLAQCVEEGKADPTRFTAVIGDLVERVALVRPGVRIFGEMVGLLADAGEYVAAVDLERLWNKLQATYPFTLFCAYPIVCLAGDELSTLFSDVCAEHSGVVPTESYSALESADARLRAIAALQQKAESLEAALAAERAARAAAEEALRLRDVFVSIAAHELKTPVTSVKGFAQLILRRLALDGQIEPERLTPALRAIVGQTDRLSRLTTQLLDVSRLDAGKLTLEPQPTDLVALVEQAVDVARSWSNLHDIQVTAPATLEAWVDPLRYEQVLVNLLDNAVKYSPAGGSIEVELSSRNDDVVELRVRDHGLGIPPEKRGRLFERYYQAHAAVHRSGLGLGLHISQQIVELHGGTIQAEFPEDGGTRFIARLPVHT